jgi:hypothetical protein
LIDVTLLFEGSAIGQAECLVPANALYSGAYVELDVPLEVVDGGPMNETTLWFETLDHEIFAFSGPGHGSLGHQDRLSDGDTERSFRYEETDSTHNVSILIPEGSTVSNATLSFMSMEKVLNWTEPEYLVEEIDGNQVPFITKGQISADFADLDGDGDLELVRSGWSPAYNMTTHIYENIGSAGDPVFSYSQVLSKNITMEQKSHPRFTDVDGDGDADLFVGEYHGRMKFFRNNGTPYAPIWNRESFLDGYTFGYEPCPAFYDLDADGDPDMVIGNKNSFDPLMFFWNNGTPSELQFVKTSMFGDPLGHRLYFPSFSDYDLDGDADLFLGHWEPNVTLIENTGNSSSPSWSREQTFLEDTDFGYYYAPSFADLSGDGYEDLVIGVLNGALRFLARDVSIPTELSLGFGSLNRRYDIGNLPRVTREFNITQDLQTMIDNPTGTTTDGYTTFIQIDLSVGANRLGGLVLTDISISYEATLRTRDFSYHLNSHLHDIRATTPWVTEENFTLLFGSPEDGRTVTRVRLDYRYPLSISGLKEHYYCHEDGVFRRFIDLRDHIEYEQDLGDLQVELLALGEALGNVLVTDGLFISVDNTMDHRLSNWSGAQVFQVRVRDPEGFFDVSDPFTIVTRPLNDPPVITSVPVRTAYEDRKYSYHIVAEDPDTAELNYTPLDVPTGLILDGNGSILWTPREEDVGKTLISVMVDDGEFEVEHFFELMVIGVNDPPSINLPHVVVQRGSATTLDWTPHVTDVDTPLPDIVMISRSDLVTVQGFDLVIRIPPDFENSSAIAYLEVDDGEFAVPGPILILVEDPESGLGWHEVPALTLWAGVPFEMDIGPYIVYDGPFEELRVFSPAEPISVDGLNITIVMGIEYSGARTSIPVGVTNADVTAFVDLRITVLKDLVDGLVLPVPMQFVTVGIPTSIELGQYIHPDIPRETLSITSESDNLISSSGPTIEVLYETDGEIDRLRCQLVYEGGTIDFEVPIAIEAAAMDPYQIKQIPDVTVKDDEVEVIDLNDHFLDHYGNPLLFEGSDPLLVISSEGIMSIAYDRSRAGDTIVCYVMVRDPSVTNDPVVSNSFTVSFEDENEPDDLDAWLGLAVVLGCMALALTLLVLFRRTKKQPEE